MRSKTVVLAICMLAFSLFPAIGLQAAQNSDASLPVASLSGTTETLLPDGTTLMLGGIGGDGQVQARAVIQSSATVAATAFSTRLSFARAGHTATVLPDGTVLVLGGVGVDGKVVSAAEIFDPLTRSFHVFSSGAPAPRAFHTATLLTDGRILIAGGVSANGQILLSAELWDFRQKQHAIEIPWVSARRGHTARLLANGEVLLQGGKDDRGKSAIDAFVFNPDSLTFAQVKDAGVLQQEEKSAAEVRASSPQDGATDVAIDALISMRFSKPVSMATIGTQTVSLIGPNGSVEARIVAAEGGMLAFVTPSAALLPGSVYQVTLNGAADAHGALVPFAQFTFTTAGEAPGDVEHWQPTSDWRTHAQPSAFEKLPLPHALPGVTALAGRVLKLDGKPLPGVTLKIGKRKAVTDRNGQFLMVNIEANHQVLVIDATTANHGKTFYGLYETGLEIVPGQTNVVPYTIWMTALDMAHEVTIPSPTTTETVIKTPLLPGLELHLLPQTVITDSEGKPVTKLTITPIPLDRTPFPLPNVNMPVFFTVQPGLSYVHVGGPGGANRGARLFYPNVISAPSGAIFDLWHYDADGVGWFVYGQGRVEADGSQIIPFPGAEIYEFTGAGVATPSGTDPATGSPACGLKLPPGVAGPPAPPCPKAIGGEPVDLSTGLFVYDKTDLVVSDVVPLELTRTYRPGDSVSRAFGIGTTHPYDMFIVPDNNFNGIGIGFDLILPDGGRIHFDCASVSGFACTSLIHDTSPTGFYGATLTTVGNNLALTMKNGTILKFLTGSSVQSPFQLALISITDRYGNTVTINRDPSTTNGHFNRATSIVSPNGRSISFTYDSFNHVTQAANNGGQTVNYAYDSYGHLVAVADANAAACVTSNPSNWTTACPVTSYTYDHQHRMLTVTDPKGILYLTNQYDGTSFRVHQQTLADGSTFIFTWTIANQTQGHIYIAGSGGGGGPAGIQLNRYCGTCSEGYTPLISRVDVTDQRNNIRRVIFGPTGYMTDDYHAFGQAEQQHYVYQYYADNLLKQVQDPMLNVTSYDYDNNGNLSNVTWHGTSPAATTTFTYDTGGFNRLLNVTDPLTHTWFFSYDNNGNLTTATDPLNNSSTFTYNPAGQMLTATDPLHNPTTFSYNSFGDLTSVMDPLFNTTSFVYDSVGRPLSVTDALNEKTAYQYDALNQVIQVTDPRGAQNANCVTNPLAPQNGVTCFSYDANGNLLTVKDPSQQGTNFQTSYTYDNMDRVITRTDPLQRQEFYQYDLAGNVTQYTDRRGKVTAFTNYDRLNRLLSVSFDATGTPSTINYTYDGYDRLLAAADRATSADLCPTVLSNATICRTYNDLSRTYTETTPQGTITYTADLAGLRHSMTVAGQPAVSYNFDAANRLQYISQATTPATVTNFYYDADSRRTSLTLPNGVSTTYCYDLDSRLTGLLYNNGAAVSCPFPGSPTPSLGTLAYSYDPLGRRTQVSGSFARTGLPQPVASAAYDAANELLQWNGQLFNYDLNGNMTSDGGNAYTWDARNQLAQFNATSFQYDAFGRRTQNATGTGFLYDGADSVQELSGTTPTSNRITGGIDEFFSRTQSGTSYTPLADGLGSTIALLDPTGSLTTATQYTYDPFGNTTTSGTASSNSFQYAGRENEGNGLYYYRARYYSPVFGRFISEDPIGFGGGGANFYAYTLDSPINFVDPLGLSSGNCQTWGPWGWTTTCNDPPDIYPVEQRAEQAHEAVHRRNFWDKLDGSKSCTADELEAWKAEVPVWNQRIKELSGRKDTLTEAEKKELKYDKESRDTAENFSDFQAWAYCNQTGHNDPSPNTPKQPIHNMPKK